MGLRHGPISPPHLPLFCAYRVSGAFFERTVRRRVLFVNSHSLVGEDLLGQGAGFNHWTVTLPKCAPLA